MKRLGMYALIGLFLGLFNSFFIQQFDSFSIASMSSQIAIVLLAICSVMSLFFIVQYIQIKTSLNKSVDENKADEHDALINRKASDLSLANFTVVVLSITGLCVSVVSKIDIWLTGALAVLMLCSIWGTSALNGLTQLIHKDRVIPKWHDKNYNSAIFNAMDEGERHITFVSLHKAFTLTNMILPFTLIILMFYSEFTGDSQLFSILLIAIVLLIINMRYLLTVRAQYK